MEIEDTFILRDRWGNAIDDDEYIRLLRIPGYKVIGTATVGEFYISCIWLGVPHSKYIISYDLDCYFELMVFHSSGEIVEQLRFRTDYGALITFLMIVAKVRLARELPRGH